MKTSKKIDSWLSIRKTFWCIWLSQMLLFFFALMMRFDRTKRVTFSMLFRHSIAPFKIFLHSFKNETIFDTKLSKTWYASFFTCFKDFLNTIMDKFNFTTIMKLKNSMAIVYVFFLMTNTLSMVKPRFFVVPSYLSDFEKQWFGLCFLTMLILTVLCCNFEKFHNI